MLKFFIVFKRGLFLNRCLKNFTKGNCKLKNLSNFQHFFKQIRISFR